MRFFSRIRSLCFQQAGVIFHYNSCHFTDFIRNHAHRAVNRVIFKHFSVNSESAVICLSRNKKSVIFALFKILFIKEKRKLFFVRLAAIGAAIPAYAAFVAKFVNMQYLPAAVRKSNCNIRRKNR